MRLNERVDLNLSQRSNSGSPMRISTYQSIRRNWSYWAYLLNAVALVLLVVLLKRSDEEHLVVTHVILAEISVFCWAFQLALTLVAIGPSLKRVDKNSDDAVVARILADVFVERRIWTILGVATVLFAALLNVTFALREVSMLIPIVYFFVASIVVSLTSPWTSRLLLQRVVNAALLDSKPDHEHQRRDKNNESRGMH
jgi:putative Mn2+ efflux pump MntP